MNIFISTWVLLVAGLVFMVPMMILRIKDTTDLEDETVYVPNLSCFETASDCLSFSFFISARMDSSGHVKPTEQVALELKQEAQATHGVA
jgi:hypothetical protein